MRGDSRNLPTDALSCNRQSTKISYNYTRGSDDPPSPFRCIRRGVAKSIAIWPSKKGTAVPLNQKLPRPLRRRDGIRGILVAFSCEERKSRPHPFSRRFFRDSNAQLRARLEERRQEELEGEGGREGGQRLGPHLAQVGDGPCCRGGRAGPGRV